MENKDAVLGKIKKLMAIGMRHEDTPEGKSALAKANKLMAKHDIRFMDVEDDGTIKDENVTELVVAWHKKVNKFEGHLANCIAESMGCRYIITHRDGKTHSLVGTTSDVEMAAWLFKFTRLQCYRLAEKQSYTGKDLRTYFFGMLHVLQVKIEDTFSKVESEERTVEECTALVVVKDAAVTKKVEELFPKLRKGRKSAPLTGSRDAYMAGGADGAKVKIQNSIASNGNGGNKVLGN